MIGRPTGQSVRPVGRSVHTLRQSARQSDEIKHVGFFDRLSDGGRSVYTIRSSDRPVGQTSRSDRPVGPTIGTCKRPLTNIMRKRLKYCSPTTPCIIQQFNKADKSLFQTVLTDHHHVLYHLLPPNKTHQYTSRSQYHSLTLSCLLPPNKTHQYTSRSQYHSLTLSCKSSFYEIVILFHVCYSARHIDSTAFCL